MYTNLLFRQPKPSINFCRIYVYNVMVPTMFSFFNKINSIHVDFVCMLRLSESAALEILLGSFFVKNTTNLPLPYKKKNETKTIH